jgi:uncharacterized protein YggE
MQNQHVPTVSVSASGSASAPYDQVFFKITVWALGDTGPLAKAGMKESAERVLAYVDSLIHEKKAQNKVALLKLAPHQVYVDGRNCDRGYRASLAVTFSTNRPELAAEIQDRLTEFNQTRVESLTFGVTNIESLREKAVEAAWEIAARRFEHSLKTTTGSGSDLWDVESWNVNYEEHRALSKMSAPTEDEDGTANLRVTLEVTWRRR